MVKKTKKVRVTARRKGRKVPSHKRMATHHKRRPPGYEEISYPVAAAPWEREDWEARKKEIVSTAKEVVDLYERLGKVLGEGGKRVGGYGHNREPEQLELRVTVLADETKAHKNIDELQRELSSGTPRKRVLSRLGHAWNKLRAGAEAQSVDATAAASVCAGVCQSSV